MFIYLDQNNQPQHATREQLKDLAEQGIIGPATPLKARDGGYIGTVGQIPDIFPPKNDVPPRGTASEWISEVVSGISAAKAAAKAKLKLNGLKAQLVDTYRSLGDVAEQAGWGGKLCEDIKQKRQEVADATALYGKAATDAELAKNTPGATAAKQVLSEAKTRMSLATGVLDGLREKAGQTLMDDVAAASQIDAKQRTEFLQLWGEIAECEWTIAHGKQKLRSKPLLATAGGILLIGLVVLIASEVQFRSDPFKNSKPGDWFRYDFSMTIDPKLAIRSQMNEQMKMTVLLEVVSKDATKIAIRTTGMAVDPRGQESTVFEGIMEIDSSELSEIDTWVPILLVHPSVSSDPVFERRLMPNIRKRESLTTTAGKFYCIVSNLRFTNSVPVSTHDGETGDLTITGTHWTSTSIPWPNVVKQEVEATMVTKMRTETVTGTATLAASGNDPTIPKKWKEERRNQSQQPRR